MYVIGEFSSSGSVFTELGLECLESVNIHKHIVTTDPNLFGTIAIIFTNYIVILYIIQLTTYNTYK